MYQGLGQMLTMRLQHHQGCSETQKCAYVIYGQPLIAMMLSCLRLLRHLPPAAARNYQLSIDAKTRASKTAVTFGGHTANLVY